MQNSSTYYARISTIYTLVFTDDNRHHKSKGIVSFSIQKTYDVYNSAIRTYISDARTPRYIADVCEDRINSGIVSRQQTSPFQYNLFIPIFKDLVPIEKYVANKADEVSSTRPVTSPLWRWHQ